ncbi:MAG: hypothetical protein ABI557_10300 [Aureliella sp.]
MSLQILRRTPLTRSLLFMAAFAPVGINASNSLAAERPTFNHTLDPRPDILPHPFTDSHTGYRRAYNRPRFWGGWIADKVSLTSQEAMVWQDSLAAGLYDGKNCPPVYKTYYYPKSWEVLQTGPRPNFLTPANNAAGIPDQGVAEEPVPQSGIDIVPQLFEEASPKSSSRRYKAVE